jgi:hypothetical protein
MNKTCHQCSATFEISQEDLAFLDTVSPIFNGKKESIPPPTLCPDCRQQRRAAWRNERSLHRRTCDGTGKPIVAMYPAGTPFPVYAQEYWWGDSWSATEFGQEWDPDKPFFPQFGTLLSRVPRLSAIVSKSENCEYNSFCVRGKNCYMSQRVGDSEDAYFTYHPIESRSVMDSYGLSNCELCYEVVDGVRCYNVHHAQNVAGCADAAFLFNCRDCRDCFLCSNLRNSRYCFRNQQLTKEEYERQTAAFRGHAALQRARDELETLRRKSIVPALWANSVENVSGNYLFECKNTLESFDCQRCEDVRRSYGHTYGKDCLDCTFGYHCDLCYEFAAGSNAQQLLFCFNILYDCYNLAYCIDCVNGSHDLFGCISMKHAQYCILNKQYTKEEYERLVPKIIERMRKDREWGEYFPASLSPFPYNETNASEYFPLTKEEVTKRGWKWRDQIDEAPKVTRVIPAAQLPDAIENVPDDILNWAIQCEMTNRPFKIIKQELDFYRRMKLPVPRLHPDERHRKRMALRNPRKLWERNCAKCGTEIQTTYAPERPEIVYCEKCYLKEVY